MKSGRAENEQAESVYMITTREELGDPRAFEKEAPSTKDSGFDAEIVNLPMKVPVKPYEVRFLQLTKTLQGDT